MFPIFIRLKTSEHHTIYVNMSTVTEIQDAGEDRAELVFANSQVPEFQVADGCNSWGSMHGIHVYHSKEEIIKLTDAKIQNLTAYKVLYDR